MFRKILVANRGEIAVRIIRACKEMGIHTVAVFSEADTEALHVHMADESVCIGPPHVTESYLNMASILSAAVHTGAEALHPGYGLLSENAKFAGLCRECGVKFIGPSPEVISRMGDKDEARRAMIAAGVPVVPGSGVVNILEDAAAEAARIGFPLLVKARAGGGGRGIRRVENMDEFPRAWENASAEAIASFGDGAVYLEKFLHPVKHIEMQILADAHGNVVSLGERECSMQRRNQKVLEESPSSAVTPTVRAAMAKTATAAAKAVGYENAGTIEFLLDKDNNFYFMEMNTRLQVEHPVTEMVAGIDLVQWQIRIAAGQELPYKQDNIKLKGHAIECRINAENPALNFRPSCGKIQLLHVPGGPGVRFDSAVYQGYTVPPFYDSMIGKLIAYANTRPEAIRKMQAALSELVIEGIDHNAEMQSKLMNSVAFTDGTYHTGYLTEKPEEASR